MYTPWHFMVSWLDGTLSGASEAHNIVAVHSNLLAKGAIIAPGRHYVKGLQVS
mgnify:FL=1